MEQKQLDELDESYFGEEFIDDDSFDDLELEDTARVDAAQEDDDFDDIVIEDLATKSKMEKKVVKKVKAASPLKMEKSEMTSGSSYKETKPLADEKKSAESFAPKKKTVKENPKKEMKSAVDVAPTVNPWEGEAKDDAIKTASKPEKSEKVKTNDSNLFAETSTWKAISAVVVVLLVFSVFTQGFHFSDGSQITTGAVAGDSMMAGKEITLAQAEERVLDYVNRNLLRPPYVAELVSSAELQDVFKIKLSVSGQDVDSYLTKDGRYFFPQGFDISYAIVVETDDEVSDVSADDTDTEMVDIAPPEEVTTAPVEETVQVTEEVGGVGGATTELTLTAKKWLFSPQELTVKNGDKVVLTIVPEGLEFTFAIPDFGIEKQVSGTTTVEFTAAKAGEFPFSCSSCESWRGMTGTLVVE